MSRLANYFCTALGAALLALPLAASASTVLPDFSAATFKPGAKITNPYLPFMPGIETVLSGSFIDNGETTTEVLQRRVLSGRVNIGGIDAVVVRDRALVNGVKREDTFDYYAQDTTGNVWYLGEDATNYVYDANGNLIGTNNKSTWRTGVNGGLPGYAMPGPTPIGFEYYQEFAAADGALDIGQTYGLNLTLNTVLGQLGGVQQVFETSLVDPTLREFKYYAPGIGLVKVGEHLDANFQPAFELNLVSISSVPESSAWALMITGFGLAGASLRRRRPASA